MEAANLLNFHPLGRSKSYHGGFIQKLFHTKIILSVNHFFNYEYLV
jgi:hypothetical protein